MNNPKQESNAEQRSNASYAGNSANGQEAELRGKYPISTFRGATQDELVEFITTHTTKLLNEQLERITDSLTDTVSATEGYLTLRVAIENERRKLK